MGSLSVYLKKNGKLGFPEWSRSRNQGNRWIRGEYRIKNMKEPYQIVFEAVYNGLYSVRIFIFFIFYFSIFFKNSESNKYIFNFYFIF